MMTTSDPAVDSYLARVTPPRPVVMGSKDPDVKDAAGEVQWIADPVRGTVLLVEGASHYPHAEMPGEVGPEIAHFLSADRSSRAA